MNKKWTIVIAAALLSAGAVAYSVTASQSAKDDCVGKDKADCGAPTACCQKKK